MNRNRELGSEPYGARQTTSEKQNICLELQALINRVQALTTDRVLRLRQVADMSGRAPATVWKDVSDGTFPPPFSIGPRSVGWKESEVAAWIDARVFATRSHRTIDIKEFVTLLIRSRGGAIAPNTLIAKMEGNAK